MLHLVVIYNQFVHSMDTSCQHYSHCESHSAHYIEQELLCKLWSEMWILL